MFKTRVLSGIVLVAIIILMNFMGGPVMGGILFLVAIQGLFEFYRMSGVYGGSYDKKHNALEIVGYLGTVAYSLVVLLCREDRLVCMLLVIVSVFIAMLGVYVFTFPKYNGDMIMKAFYGFIYLPVLLNFIYLTRDLEGGAYYVWLIYISSWICDTFAYLTGMTIGKKKLAPVLSPKKSVEGSIGGIAGSALVAALYAFLLRRVFAFDNNGMMISFVIICIVGAIVSQIGDLSASAFKRNNDIKDYGKIIPGHGGILDRFDSVIFTAPMIYFLSVILLKVFN